MTKKPFDRRFLALLVGMAVAAAILVGVVPVAWGYFTDSTAAEGTVSVSVEPSTDIEEWYGERTKHVVITNAANSTMPVYVRARVFSALPYTASGEGWSAQGEWLTYEGIVQPGGRTADLLVGIEFPAAQTGERADGAVVGDNYNVVVVYEITPVQYDAAGTPFADWSFTLNSGR